MGRTRRSGSPTSCRPLRLPASSRGRSVNKRLPMKQLEQTHNASVAITANGERSEVAFAAYKTLLEVLREDLNLCGTKHGCELGECGACAVLLDGQPVLSCLVLGVDCDGRSVTTVEGLA